MKSSIEAIKTNSLVTITSNSRSKHSMQKRAVCIANEDCLAGIKIQQCFQSIYHAVEPDRYLRGVRFTKRFDKSMPKPASKFEGVKLILLDNDCR